MNQISDIVIVTKARRLGWLTVPRKVFHPLLLADQHLNDRFRIRFLYELSDKFEADGALVDSRLFYGLPRDETCAYLERIRRRVKWIDWLDTRDSAGNTQFFILPYVDHYRKNQLYSDRGLYDQQFVANRIYADKLSAVYNLRGVNCTDYDAPLKDFADHANKISIGWNIGLSDFVNFRGWREILCLHYLRQKEYPRWIPPSNNRKIDVNIRFSLGKEPLYAGHRKSVIDTVRNSSCTVTSQQFVPKLEYMKELRHSKIVISPFGWGEVCYRDFEAIINGACLVKPNVDHLQTWPNVYLPNSTYVPVSWDLSDLSETIDNLLCDEPMRIRIAQQAQNVFKSFQSKEGTEAFAERFANWRR